MLTELLQGHLLLRVAGMQDSDHSYFSSRKRFMQFAVQVNEASLLYYASHSFLC
jgi:hypothetical protein